MSLFAKAKKIKENKKGFTLVELIVVLVILAILAAFLVPTLTGYIDKAKQKTIVAETRSAVMAAQTLVDEDYGLKTPTLEDKIDDDTTPSIGDVATLAEVTADNITSITLENGKVTELVYTKDDSVCTYSSSTGDYNVTKATS